MAGRYAGPPPGQARQFVAAEEAMTPDPWQNPLRSGEDANAPVNKDRFPAQYYSHSTGRDTRYALKQQAVQGGYYGPNGTKAGANTMVTIPLTDADFDYMQSKADEQEAANFKIWCEQWYDMANPAEIRLFQEAFPEYFDQRVALIKNMAENMTRFAILRLYGPRTKEDFMFLWMVQTNRVPLVTGPLWQPDTWSKEGPSKRYALFNPWRMLNRENTPNMPNKDNRMDPIGLPDKAYFVPKDAASSVYQSPLLGGGGVPSWMGGLPGFRALQQSAGYSQAADVSGPYHTRNRQGPGSRNTAFTGPI